MQKTFARTHRDRVWAVEGARGFGAGLAQRLVAEGEPVLDVPARLSARVRALGGGSGRKTDDADAFAVAVAGLRARARELQVVRPDDTTEILRMLTTRRQEVVELRIATVNRLHAVLCRLIPGGAQRHLTAPKARPLLSGVRPRDAVGRHAKQLALDYTRELLQADVEPTGRHLLDCVYGCIDHTLMTGFEQDDRRHPVDRMLELWNSPPGPEESAVRAFRDVYVDPYRLNGTSIPVLQIVQRARVLHAALDSLEHVVLDRVEAANRTVLLLRQEGIHVGPLPTPLGMLAPTGRRVHRRVVEFIEHDDHRLLQVTALGDDLERLMQAEAVCLIQPGSSSAASG